MLTASTAWHDAATNRGALLRLLLFVPLYLALEYLLTITFFGVAGAGLKGSAQFLSSGATLLAALSAGGAMLIGVDQRRTGALGFAWTSRSLRESGMGFVIGGAGIVAAALLAVALGMLRYTPDGGTATLWVTTLLFDMAVFAIAAAAEEAVFRGYGFQVLVRPFGPVVATVGTSAAFAMAHAGNPNVTAFALLNIFLAGVLLGWAYLRTMSLWFATAVHLGWNWTMASLFDLPVSGLAMFQTPLYEPVASGPAWIGGGSFGPEGGLAGTIGMLVCLLALAWWVPARVAPEMAALRPLAMAPANEELVHE